MPFPSDHDLDDAVLVFLHLRGGVTSPGVVYECLSNYFGLSNCDLAEKRPSGASKWENLILFSIKRLREDGYAFRPKDKGRGNWILTSAGEQEGERKEKDFGAKAIANMRATIDRWGEDSEALLSDLVATIQNKTITLPDQLQ